MGNQPDLTELTVAELRELARERELAGYSKLKKAELVELLGPAAVAAEQQAAMTAALAGAGTSPAAEPVPTPEPVAEDQYEFPPSYDRDTVVLLARDPHWLYSYWDIGGPTWVELERRGITAPQSGWRPILRFHDVTDRGAPSAETRLADLPVFTEARDWYLEAPRPSRTYLVEFGYLSASGEFYRIAVSNAAPVPRSAPSPRVDASWGSLTDEAYRLSLAGGDPRVALGSAELLRKLEGLLEEAISSGRFSAGIGSQTVAGGWR